MRIEGRTCVTTTSFAEVAHSENLCLRSCEEELLSKESVAPAGGVWSACEGKNKREKWTSRLSSCRLSAQTVPENSLHPSAIHFTALNR